MTYYPDLTTYEYFAQQHGLLNVGWLSKDHTFSRGSVPYQFASELHRLTQSPVNLCRGHHVCELCQPPADVLTADKEYYWVWAMGRSGNGEVHVLSASGIIYAAPTLIWHYVIEHQYQPPQEFIDAVLFHKVEQGQK